MNYCLKYNVLEFCNSIRIFFNFLINPAEKKCEVSTLQYINKVFNIYGLLILTMNQKYLTQELKKVVKI